MVVGLGVVVVGVVGVEPPPPYELHRGTVLEPSATVLQGARESHPLLVANRGLSGKDLRICKRERTAEVALLAILLDRAV